MQNAQRREFALTVSFPIPSHSDGCALVCIDAVQYHRVPPSTIQNRPPTPGLSFHYLNPADCREESDVHGA